MLWWSGGIIRINRLTRSLASRPRRNCRLLSPLRRWQRDGPPERYSRSLRVAESDRTAPSCTSASSTDSRGQQLAGYDIWTVLLNDRLQSRRDAGEIRHKARRNCNAVFRNADRVDKRLPHNPITAIDKRPEIYRSYGLLTPCPPCHEHRCHNVDLDYDVSHRISSRFSSAGEATHTGNCLFG
jgi:hypothetical protein